MSAPMKKPRTELIKMQDSVGRLYELPCSVAKRYCVTDDSMSAEAFFEEYEEAYSKPGLILRGIRVREDLTQAEFAKLINVTQTNLSKMECGTRPIGKEMAKRIAEVFDINYQSLL